MTNENTSLTRREFTASVVAATALGTTGFTVKETSVNTKGKTPMKHKVKLTVIDRKCYPELQEKYCADPKSGPCPCYNVGDEFVLYRDGERDDFWHMGLNTLVKTSGDPDKVAGGPKMPHCSELWDDISILHDQSPLRNGDVTHPARDGYIRAARLPVIAHPMPSLRMERSAHRRKVSASSGIT